MRPDRRGWGQLILIMMADVGGVGWVGWVGDSMGSSKVVASVVDHGGEERVQDGEVGVLQCEAEG